MAKLQKPTVLFVQGRAMAVLRGNRAEYFSAYQMWSELRAHFLALTLSMVHSSLNDLALKGRIKKILPNSSPPLYRFMEQEEADGQEG
jgi:hypothetical protein